MLETIRKYWIAALVLVLVVLHASIVGIIRYQASLAKKDISCEVHLGDFTAYRTKAERPIEMSLHAIVPLKHRMKSRQLIELNQAQVRQSLEEHLRQFDSRLLADPYLTDLRSQLLDILTQTLGASSVEDVIVTEIRPVGDADGIEFLSNAARPEPRKLVVSLREDEGASDDEEIADSDAVDGSDTSHAAEHNDPPKAPSNHHPSNHHGSSGHAKTNHSSGHAKKSGKH